MAAQMRRTTPRRAAVSVTRPIGRSGTMRQDPHEAVEDAAGRGTEDDERGGQHAQAQPGQSHRDDRSTFTACSASDSRTRARVRGEHDAGRREAPSPMRTMDRRSDVMKRSTVPWAR